MIEGIAKSQAESMLNEYNASLPNGDIVGLFGSLAGVVEEIEDAGDEDGSELNTGEEDESDSVEENNIFDE